MESQSSVLAVSDSVFAGSDSEDGSADFFPEQTWIVVLIAVLFFVAFALVIWACCVYCSRRRRRRGPRGGSGPGGHGASQPSHQFEVQFKTGGGSKGGAFRSPNVMNISGSAGEGEFDIGRHIQQNLMASRINRDGIQHVSETRKSDLLKLLMGWLWSDLS